MLIGSLLISMAQAASITLPPSAPIEIAQAANCNKAAILQGLREEIVGESVQSVQECYVVKGHAIVRYQSSTRRAYAWVAEYEGRWFHHASSSNLGTVFEAMPVEVQQSLRAASGW